LSNIWFGKLAALNLRMRIPEHGSGLWNIWSAFNLKIWFGTGRLGEYLVWHMSLFGFVLASEPI
jgi:hypothetical protein